MEFRSLLGALFGTDAKEIELDSGSSIQDLLDHLCDSYQRRRAIFDDSGKLRPNVRILKNGGYITYIKMSENGLHPQFMSELDVKLEEGDVILMFQPLAGG